MFLNDFQGWTVYKKWIFPSNMFLSQLQWKFETFFQDPAIPVLQLFTNLLFMNFL